MNTETIFSSALILAATMSVQTQAKSLRTNILFAISDDQSFAHTGFGGCSFVKTPAFDQVAKEGVYFTNCYAGSPGCAPSRSSIVTGRYPWQNEQSGQHASSWMKKYVPFVDLLEANGYYTGKTGKGVAPFQYARSEVDSLWRKTDAAGIDRSHILYRKGSKEDERFAKGIGAVNYFENFKYFINHRPEGKPFFFWYGATEPHRDYEKDSWKRNGKRQEDAHVPGFLPKDGIIRGDLLDYAVEIEWFDLHLQRMLDYLKSIGELENTIVIVTADNGMPFPRAKANCFEYGVHVPLAVRYPAKFPGGRIVDDPVSFVDLAPTILELAETSEKGMLPISGKSMTQILQSNRQGTVDRERKYIYAGRERHSSSRYKNWGYPQRAIRSEEYLLIWNQRPERWPAGAPQRIKPETTDELLPMYGIDENGIHHSDWAFTDIDGSPSKSFIVENYRDKAIEPYFRWATGQRPEYELYRITEDPFCLNNLAGKNKYKTIESELKQALLNELTKTNDPRVTGPDPEVFDSYLRYSPLREFPKPDNSR
ncbi:MAG: sulfatase [Mangrovibacterium sp.]